MNQYLAIGKDYRRSKRVDKHPFYGLCLCLLACLCFACDFSADTGQSTFTEAEFGAVVTAGKIDKSNTPMDIRTTFSREDGVIYAVFEVKRLEPGTNLYVRWTNQASKFEEHSASLTADRSYQDIYLEFHLEPVQGTTLTALETGQYDVQLFVNEQAGPKTSFQLD